MAQSAPRSPSKGEIMGSIPIGAILLFFFAVSLHRRAEASNLLPRLGGSRCPLFCAWPASLEVHLCSFLGGGIAWSPFHHDGGEEELLAAHEPAGLLRQCLAVTRVLSYDVGQRDVPWPTVGHLAAYGRGTSFSQVEQAVVAVIEYGQTEAVHLAPSNAGHTIVKHLTKSKLDGFFLAQNRAQGLHLAWRIFEL